MKKALFFSLLLAPLFMQYASNNWTCEGQYNKSKGSKWCEPTDITGLCNAACGRAGLNAQWSDQKWRSRGTTIYCLCEAK